MKAMANCLETEEETLHLTLKDKKREELTLKDKKREENEQLP